MKSVLLIATLALAPLAVSAAPLENGAIYTNGWSRAHAQDLANDASMLIRRAGYSCSSISVIRSWFSGGGFTVHCNDYRYEYELEDRGGRWVVTVQ